MIKVFRTLLSATFNKNIFTPTQIEKYKEEAELCKKNDSPVTNHSLANILQNGSQMLGKEHFYINDSIIEGCK